jgi:hypothetical protein
MRNREVYVGEAPLDTSAPPGRPGQTPSVVGEYRHTKRTVALAHETWPERLE